MGLERQRGKSEAHGRLSALSGLLVHAFELIRSRQELSAFERSLCGNGIEALGDKEELRVRQARQNGPCRDIERRVRLEVLPLRVGAGCQRWEICPGFGKALGVLRGTSVLARVWRRAKVPHALATVREDVESQGWSRTTAKGSRENATGLLEVDDVLDALDAVLCYVLVLLFAHVFVLGGDGKEHQDGLDGLLDEL